MTDPIQIWVTHVGNQTSTKAESLQAKRDILVPQGLLLGCPATQHRLLQSCSPPSLSHTGTDEQLLQVNTTYITFASGTLHPLASNPGSSSSSTFPFCLMFCRNSPKLTMTPPPSQVTYSAHCSSPETLKQP